MPIRHNQPSTILPNTSHAPQSIGAVLRRVRDWLRPATPWVALLGVDGSGKTSVLNRLVQVLPSAYTGLFVMHRRPQIVFRSAAAQQPGPIQHYAKLPHHPILSVFKLGAIGCDWLLGYWFRIRWRQTRGMLVVADRHALLDLLADPHRYRYAGPKWLIRLCVRLLPMPDVIIFLDAPVAVLQARKTELTAENAAALRIAYLELSQQLPSSYVIDASQPLPQVVTSVYHVVVTISPDHLIPQS